MLAGRCWERSTTVPFYPESGCVLFSLTRSYSAVGYRAADYSIRSGSLPKREGPVTGPLMGRNMRADVPNDRTAQPEPVCQSRYTRSVAWRHRIALVLLLALTGIPVGGTVCAMLCESAATQSAAHHGKDPKCAEPAIPSSGPQISGGSAHDCSTHDASMRQVATTAVERTDSSAKVPSTVVDFASHGGFVLHDCGNSFAYSAPPGTDPPTVRPVVLRV
jgi:hypothetical protein